MIRKADKGNAICILDTVDYLYEGFKQLSNTEFYSRVDADLTPLFESKANRLIHDLFIRGFITKKVKNYLWSSHCNTASFYLLPKIHKKNIPDRPIVSSNDCPSEKLSELVYLILNPLVQHTKSYIRDTSDFINKISPTLPFHITAS